MIHTIFSLVVSEEMNTHLPGGGHFEFYTSWPPEIDHNLFAMVFETFTPIPNTVPNLKNLAPSARFDLYLVYSSPAKRKMYYFNISVSGKMYIFHIKHQAGIVIIPSSLYKA